MQSETNQEYHALVEWEVDLERSGVGRYIMINYGAKSTAYKK